jgi:hypothetical protein
MRRRAYVFADNRPAEPAAITLLMDIWEQSARAAHFNVGLTT